MHARELIEVAATLCLDARRLLDETPPLGESALGEYWVASRCRLDNWSRLLGALAHPSRASGSQAVPLAAIAQDVLLSQVHTRCLTAIAVAHDRRHGVDRAGPIGRNALSGHDEAVSRLRAIVAASSGPRSHAAAAYRLLANRAERWTDLLLGYVLPLCDPPGARSPAGHAVEFAFDAARAQEFSYDAQQQLGPDDRWAAAATQLVQHAIRRSLAHTTAPSPTAALNRRIAGASIALFGRGAFDDCGLLRSAWIDRLEKAADDTVGMLEQLFNEQQPPTRRAALRWQR